MCRALRPPPPQAPSPQAGTGTDELGDPLTSYDSITHYNNYYEFSTGQGRGRQAVAGLQDLAVDGAGGRAGQQAQDVWHRGPAQDFTQEERIYRLRCVEAWSMVIPWMGFPLSELLKEVEPLSKAKYVRFETMLDPQADARPKRWLFRAGPMWKACASTRRCTT